MIKVKIGNGIIVQEPIMFTSFHMNKNQNFQNYQNYQFNQSFQNYQNSQIIKNNQNIPQGLIKVAPKKKVSGNFVDFTPEKLQNLNKTKEYLINVMNRFFPESNDNYIKKNIEY